MKAKCVNWLDTYLLNSVIVFVQGVEVLAKNCPGLTTFLSRGCILIGDDAMTHLARYCPRLNTVNIQGCLVNLFLTGKCCSLQLSFPFAVFNLIAGSDGCRSGPTLPKLSGFALFMSVWLWTLKRCNSIIAVTTLSSASHIRSCSMLFIY